MNVSPDVVVVGAGLSGLATALACSKAGLTVRVLEGAGQAGGRCRSFNDKYLDRRIDNGNHFIMSANRHARNYLKRVGAEDELVSPPFALYPFVDVSTGERWTIRFNEGPIPFWVLDAKTRIPGTKISDYLAGLKIAFAGSGKTVAEAVGIEPGQEGLLFKRLWEPMCLAILNTTPERGQANLLWRALRETFALGGQACTPMTAQHGLGTAFVEPALRTLADEGVEIAFGKRLREVEAKDRSISQLQFSDETLDISGHTQIVLALPPSRLHQVMPEFEPPKDDASILNVHFLAPQPIPRDALGQGFFLGMLGGDAQWAVLHDDIVSLTVSASHAIGLDDTPNDEVVGKLWREVAIAFELGDMRYHKVRVIREKRATFDQSPEGASRRLACETRYRNLWLAGDHTQTGVPATIEGAIRSGNKAADRVIKALAK